MFREIRQSEGGWKSRGAASEEKKRTVQLSDQTSDAKEGGREPYQRSCASWAQECGPFVGGKRNVFLPPSLSLSLGRGKFTLLTMSAERGSPDRPPARLTPRGLVAVAVGLAGRR